LATEIEKDTDINSVFCDEFELKGENLSEMLDEFVKKSIMDKLKYLWIVPNSDTQTKLSKAHKDLEEEEEVNIFEILKLEYNMRNGKHINKYIKKFKFDDERKKQEVMPLLGKTLQNFPEGVQPQHFGNLSDAINAAKQSTNNTNTKKGILVIYKIDMKNSGKNAKNGVQNVEGVEIKFMKQGFSEQYVTELKETLDEETEDKCIEFLEGENHVLVVHSSCINGFEWPTIITFCDSNTNKETYNIPFRCTTYFAHVKQR